VVAIVGRPNVGKSTLVNRIVGRREAIVEERPGVTRDRKEVEADWRGREFRLVDTGGWMAGGDSLDTKVSAQAERAWAEADVSWRWSTSRSASPRRTCRSPASCAAPPDRCCSSSTRSTPSPEESDVWEFTRLGLGDPWPVSALHGRGTGDLLDEVVRLFPPRARCRRGGAVVDEGRRGGGSVAIVGRPNVGKSTLFNRLIGDDRSVVHDMPGTTRDTVDTVVDTPDGPVRFVDTAGMRRTSRIDEGTEYYSLVRALKAIDEADVAFLVIDATEGVTHQDQRLAERVDASGAPSWWCSTSGRCSGPSSASRCRTKCRPAALPRRRPCSRSAPSPARACTSSCRPWPDRSRTTTGGCPPGRSTR
jgi:GTPase